MNADTQTQENTALLDTPRDLAKAIRTTPQTINAWHRRGIIKARICIGRVIRFDRNEAIAALEEHSRKTNRKEEKSA